MSLPSLEKQVSDIHLTQGDAFVQTFPNKYSAFTLFADVVEISGQIRWPGCSVEIVCRKLIARDGAAIDVSGSEPEVSFDPEAVDNTLKGSPNSPDGKPGQSGTNGKSGGTLLVICGQCEGELQLIANGSPGGHGQRGGDGVKPKTPNGADGVFTQFAKNGDPVKSAFGGGVKQKRSAKWYVSWARGQTGGNAVNGGNAGPSGSGGDGGSGGRIETLCLDPHAAIDHSCQGGKAGSAGVPALAGPTGDPGVGGRNAICHIHGVFKDKKVVGFVSDKEKNVKFYAERFSIPSRAPSGKVGAKAGQLATPPDPAHDGKSGQATRKDAFDDETESRVSLDYLELIFRRGKQRSEIDDTKGAKERFEWILRCIEIRSSSNPEIAVLRQAAERMLHAPV